MDEFDRDEEAPLSEDILEADDEEVEEDADVIGVEVEDTKKKDLLDEDTESLADLEEEELELDEEESFDDKYDK